MLERGLLASDRDDAARAHRDREHHAARAEITGRAVDDDGLPAAQAGALQSAERHDQFCQSDQLGGRSVVEIGKRRDAGGRPVRDLGEHAVAPACLQRQRLRRRDRRSEADQDLRRIAIRHVAAQMRAQEHAVAARNVRDVLAGGDDARDRVGTRHERHRRQAVGQCARQKFVGVGQHHAGLDPHHDAIGRGAGRCDILEAKIIVGVQPPGLVRACHGFAFRWPSSSTQRSMYCAAGAAPE
nr:hypothetical protein [Bradyrhizobium sp. th.b2]